MKTVTRVITLILSIVIVSTMLVGCGGKDKLKDYKTVLASTVTEGKNTWQVYKCYDKQLVLVVLNGEIQSKKSFDVGEKEIKPMTLPDLKELTGKDTTAETAYSKSTWDASLDDAAKQVKWYETMGYKIVTKAETQKFIEVYMQNDKNEYKRVLILQGQLSVVEVKDYKFKSIDDYVF